MSCGQIFIQLEKPVISELTQREQAKIEAEIKNIDQVLKEKTTELYKLQGQMNKVAGFDLNPINQWSNGENNEELIRAK